MSPRVARQSSLTPQPSSPKLLTPQVRKSANNAKDPIRQFITTWKENPRVAGSVPVRELSAAVGELGQFYMRNGSRAPLDKATASSILGHLNRAESDLPEELVKNGGWLSNIFP